MSRCHLTYVDASTVSDYFVEHRVGRLVATRLCSMHDVRQVTRVQLAMSKTLQQVSGRAVLCADWRAIGIFSPEVADGVVAMLAVTNSKILRSAILLGPQAATFSLQAERVIRDANNPARKSFRDQDKLLDWFAECLEPDELQSAKDFLSGPMST